MRPLPSAGAISENSRVALTATIYNFDVDLTDTDRGVYESLALRVARHPSESEDFLLTRLLAYLLEFAEGITFSRGLSDPDEPAIAVKDLTGRFVAWIDVGTPDAARLHKAAKTAPRVAVYTHKDPGSSSGGSPANASTAPTRSRSGPSTVPFSPPSPPASSAAWRSASR